MLKKNFTLFILLLLIFNNTNAQIAIDSNFSFIAYGETYFSKDFAAFKQPERPNFYYNHKKNNQLGVNLAMAKLNYTSKKIRANLGLMVGDYATYNLSNEPNWAKNIFEANIGYKLSNKDNLWLDVGILNSHIGFESAIGLDCYTLTRSIVADNSPYYETGAKLGYTSKTNKWHFNLLWLNGWQKIVTPNGFTKANFGIQVNYKPNENVTFNYSNFIGSDKPDTAKATRMYHNIYIQYNLSKKLSIIAGIDIGNDQSDTKNYSYWFTPISVIQYKINAKCTTALRFEYFNDANETLIQTNIGKGFKVFGTSLNVDYNLFKKLYWRAEIKWLEASQNIFENNSKNNLSFVSNLSIKI